MLNLILALAWLTTAGVLFIVEQDREQRTAIPLSAIALVLGIYNLVRWWTSRLARAQKDQGRQLLPRRSLRRPGDDVINLDPNFNFTNAPPRLPLPPAPGTDGSGPEQK